MFDVMVDDDDDDGGSGGWWYLWYVVDVGDKEVRFSVM